MINKVNSVVLRNNIGEKCVIRMKVRKSKYSDSGGGWREQ